MPVATDQEDLIGQDEQDLGQDYREPIQPVAQPVNTLPAPTITATAAPPIAPPARPAPVAPAPARQPYPFLSPQEADYQEQMRRVGYMVRDLPIDQAQKAVAAAMKFQGIRGYREDLASGKTAAEAMAKWGPVIFAGPRESNLGQAAAMVRATRPAAPKVMNVGGVAYEISPGRATALTPPVVKPVVPKANPFDLQTHRMLTTQIQALEKELNTAALEDKGPIIREMRRLQSQADEIKAKGFQSPVSGSRNEVVRLTKAGRKAVFDANTRKFLRYATE